MQASGTVVIAAAGMGTRLGLNLPKALVEVEGRPMIAHQLDLLSDIEDVVVVVGYRARQVIDLVLSIRPQALIAFNHDYASTGTAASLSKGSQAAGDRVVALDGDLLVDRGDFYAFWNRTEVLLGLTRPTTGRPVYAHLHEEGGHVERLTQDDASEWEWCGLLAAPRQVTNSLGNGHVFSGLQIHLPLDWITVDCVEVDDPDDLVRASRWLNERGGSLRG